jgi:hypothetical protein
MLCYAKWPDRVSLLIDAVDEADARAIAVQVADGSAPSTLRVLPARTFVAEVFLDEPDEGEELEPDDEGGALLIVEPLPHVGVALALVEEGEDAPRLVGLCGDRLDTGDGVAVCDLATGHAGDHEGPDPGFRREDGTSTGRATWERAS